MSVYLIDDEDVEARVVEAPNLGRAVKAWREHLIAEWRRSGDYQPSDEGREPISVVLISDESCIREEGAA